MDQYNRLLDIFNTNSGENKDDILRQLSSIEAANQDKKAEFLLAQQSRRHHGSKQSLLSGVTSNSNMPLSINDAGIIGSAHDLMRLGDEYEDDLKHFKNQNDPYGKKNFQY
jgi:hypothetical protein